MTDYNLTGFEVVKATSLSELKHVLRERISTGLIPLGLPSVIQMRNKFNERMAVFYQSVARPQMIPVRVNK